MGHYRRKPYKKHSIDPLRDIDIKKNFLAYDFFEESNEGFYDSLPMDEDMETETIDEDISSRQFLNEPDIVKELRREEMEGKLPMWLLSIQEEDLRVSTINLSDRNKIEHRGKIVSYEDSLMVARKSLQSISSHNSNKVFFHEDDES